jgi:type IX secretion system PorP/SprF family membrane protein
MSTHFKFAIVFFSLACISTFINGQNYHFSNMHENGYINNPANITQTQKISFLLTYRNQWPGNSDFVNYNGSFLISSERLQSTLGIMFLRDVQGAGVITADYIALLYGFKTGIGRDWEFSSGLLAGYKIYSTHFGDQQFENGQQPGIVLDDRNNTYDFASGIELIYREKAIYGFSVSKLGTILPGQNIYQNIQFNLSYEGLFLIKGGYRKWPIIIEPLIFTSIQKSFAEIIYGARADYSSLIGGLYLRQNHKFQYDAIIILLGTRLGKMALYYTYDLNLSGTDSHFTKFAAHEVTFLYDMEYKRKSSKHGAIKCPKI